MNADEKLDGHITTTGPDQEKGTIVKKGDQILVQPEDTDDRPLEDIHEELA
jgi:hypothetical protein